MTKSFFVKTLLKWDETQNNRLLPWKNEKDPYKIWLSEMILQQTRVEQGISYYHKFLENFPDITALADADDKKVFKLWEGLGYYSRCQNMLETARRIQKEFDGVFPSNIETIRSLKGIGSYTAAAIASFAFHLPYPVIDGNVKRVLSRFFGIELPVDSKEGKKIIETLAIQLIDRKHPAKYNQAIMDFGATICKPKNPECIYCPLNSRCKAFKEGMVKILPKKERSVKERTRFFNFLVISDENAYLIRQRHTKDIWRNLYEFPQIESDHLFDEKEVLNLSTLKEYFRNKSFELREISDSFSQKLTHQKIIGQFIHIKCSGKPLSFMDSKLLTNKEIRQLAFPKIIATYLQKKSIG